MIMKSNFCDDCFYYRKFRSGNERYCNYLGMTGHRRPCPPGDGCTAKVGLKVNRRKKKGGVING